MLKNSDSVMKCLAEEDFDRTKSLADRFSRTEVRILAKMLILRSILGKEKKEKIYNVGAVKDNF